MLRILELLEVGCMTGRQEAMEMRKEVVLQR